MKCELGDVRGSRGDNLKKDLKRNIGCTQEDDRALRAKTVKRQVTYSIELCFLTLP